MGDDCATGALLRAAAGRQRRGRCTPPAAEWPCFHSRPRRWPASHGEFARAGIMMGPPGRCPHAFRAGEPRLFAPSSSRGSLLPPPASCTPPRRLDSSSLGLRGACRAPGRRRAEGEFMRSLLLVCAALSAGAAHAASISVESTGPDKPALVVVERRLEKKDRGQVFTKTRSPGS